MVGNPKRMLLYMKNVLVEFVVGVQIYWNGSIYLGFLVGVRITFWKDTVDVM